MSLPPFTRFALCLGLAGVGRNAGFAATVPNRAAVPAAIRQVNPDRLSAGLFSALDAAGAFGEPQSVPRVQLATADLSKGKPPLVLDGRIGVNIRIGDDPAVLPSTQRGQAEPHIYRSVANHNVLLATFQEGRYSDAGSIDCGYAVSVDGGLSWRRALIPQLTTASGGTFNRATDPVAGIAADGVMYLNTLGSVSGAFDVAAVAVSRSFDNGVTWSAPSIVFQSSSTQVMPDKNWMAVDDFANTAAAGRVVVTWTNFTSSSSGAQTGSNILESFSTDQGATWTPATAVTPAGTSNQGSQPAFLPDGSLIVAYVTFADPNSTTSFSIRCKHSTDGGLTFPAAETTIVSQVAGWDDPDLRDGVFLPSLAVARQSGDLYLTYTAVQAGTPRVLVTRSSDQGRTWTTPVVASDNPAGDSVVNPAITATADGATVAVVFMDKRNAADGHNFVDHYAGLSLDGGTTWQPNVRLTEMSSDIRYAPPTTRGYMLGDYLGVAPALASNEPCVAIWCDTRTGDSDPFTVRFTPMSASSGYAAWAIARGLTGPNADYLADADGDGVPNYLEYLDGSDPLRSDAGEALVVKRIDPATLEVDWAERADAQRMNALDGVSISPMRTYLANGFGPTAPMTPNLAATELPPITISTGLVWRGVRAAVSPGEAEALARTIQPTAGSPVIASKLVATNATDARLINVSTRGFVGTGANNMIVGFVVDGSKTMLIRAAGSGLATFGVTDGLPTPQLSLTTLTGSLVSSASGQSTQQSATTAARVGAFAFPSGGNDLALVQSVSANSYTAIVTGANGATGTALVEAYDADPTPGASTGPRVVNLSTRGNVGGNGNNALIAGFVINGTQPRRLLIRAVGPTLGTLNVSGAVSDPVLQLFAAGGTTPLATNDDWEINRSGPAVAATAQRLGAFALTASSLDSALLITLPPGGYTTEVTGVNAAASVALVEVYDAD